MRDKHARGTGRGQGSKDPLVISKCGQKKEMFAAKGMPILAKVKFILVDKESHLGDRGQIGWRRRAM